MELRNKKIKVNLPTLLIVIGVVMLGLIMFNNIIKSSSSDIELEDTTDNYNFNIQELQTKDGYNYLLYKKTDTPIIALNIRMEGGAGLDPRGYSGLGYVISQVMLSSTKNKTEYEILDILDKYSINLSFNISRDYLEINLTTLSINKDIALSLLTEVLQNNNYTNSYVNKIKNEQKVILNLNMQSQDYIASRTMINKTFKSKQNWRPVIGTVKEVESITPSIIARYKSRYIHKENPYITISGNISTSTSANYIDSIMKAINTNKKDIKTVKEQNPIKGTKTYKVVNNSNNTQSVVKFIFNSPSLSTSKELATFTILNNFLGGSGLDSILMTEIREKRGLTYGIYSSIVNTKYGSIWQISASTNKDNVEKLITQVKDVVNNFAENYYQQKLVNEVKQWTLGNKALNFMSNKSIINFISQDYFYGYNQIDIYKYNKEIKEVTKEDIINMAKKYLNTNNMYIVTVQ